MRKNRIKHFWFIAMLMAFGICVGGYAQENVVTKKVVIGIKPAPPFVKKSAGGYSGLSIDSWNLVNRKFKWDYEFKEYATVSELLQAVKNKEVDFSINPITVTANRMQEYAFSQPYFISNTVVAREKQSSLWGLIKNLLSRQFLSAVAMLAGVVFIFGFFVWLFERHKNEEFKSDKKYGGIWQGFWWSAVTMTTVGYGDKSPRTVGGRIIGLIWMFMAVVIISGLTAGIASALTVQNLNKTINSNEDLGRFKIETLSGSSSQEFLDTYSLRYTTTESVEQGLMDVKNGKTQLFIYDRPLIRYELEKLELEDKITILPQTLRKDYFAYCFPAQSTLLQEINPVLIGTLKEAEWMLLVKKYQQE